MRGEGVEEVELEELCGAKKGGRTVSNCGRKK